MEKNMEKNMEKYGNIWKNMEKWWLTGGFQVAGILIFNKPRLFLWIFDLWWGVENFSAAEITLSRMFLYVRRPVPKNVPYFHCPMIFPWCSVNFPWFSYEFRKRILSGSRKKENLVRRTGSPNGTEGLFRGSGDPSAIESRNMENTWEKHGKIDINLLSLRFFLYQNWKLCSFFGGHWGLKKQIFILTFSNSVAYLLLQQSENLSLDNFCCSSTKFLCHLSNFWNLLLLCSLLLETYWLIMTYL
jgi:hypothetical protein